MNAEGEERIFATGAVRDTANKKPMIHLISPFFLEDLGEWLRFACQDRKPKPYPPRNWEKGMPFSDTLGSGFRHIVAIMTGDESEDHIAALGFAAMALAHYRHEIKAGRMNPEIDDMPHYATFKPGDTRINPQTSQEEVYVEFTKNVLNSPEYEDYPPYLPRHLDKQCRRLRVYIAGPMRGKPLYNFSAFDEAKKQAIALGYDVISPADLDRAAGIDPIKYPEMVETYESNFASIRTIVQRDLSVLLSFKAEDGDAIALLPGWRHSIGASAEYAVAKWLGLKILDAGKSFLPLLEKK